MANKEVEHCNLFGHVNEERGTYLTTRGNTYTEKTKDSSRSKETKGKRAILKNLSKIAVGDRCIKVQSLDGPNLLNESNHNYRLVKPVMSKEGYAERMFMKISWETNFRLFSTLIQSFIAICNKKYGKDANAEKEAWMSICLSSQHL